MAQLPTPTHFDSGHRAITFFPTDGERTNAVAWSLFAPAPRSCSLSRQRLGAGSSNKLARFRLCIISCFSFLAISTPTTAAWHVALTTLPWPRVVFRLRLIFLQAVGTRQHHFRGSLPAGRGGLLHDLGRVLTFITAFSLLRDAGNPLASPPPVSPLRDPEHGHDSLDVIKATGHRRDTMRFRENHRGRICGFSCAERCLRRRTACFPFPGLANVHTTGDDHTRDAPAVRFHWMAVGFDAVLR